MHNMEDLILHDYNIVFHAFSLNSFFLFELF